MNVNIETQIFKSRNRKKLRVNRSWKRTEPTGVFLLRSHWAPPLIPPNTF